LEPLKDAPASAAENGHTFCNHREIQMKTTNQRQRQLDAVRRTHLAAMLWLAAVIAAPLHAQVCSGGADGGMDATGNQCNAAAAVASPADVPAAAPSSQTASGKSATTASAPTKVTAISFSDSVRPTVLGPASRQTASPQFKPRAGIAADRTPAPAPALPRECNLSQGIDSGCTFN
jgi:hypothetical protein